MVDDRLDDRSRSSDDPIGRPQHPTAMRMVLGVRLRRLREGALQRPIGGVKVHLGRLEHLLAPAELPHVTIQVVALCAGVHAAAGGSCSLPRFAEPDVPDVVCLERPTSALYLNRTADVEQYAAVTTSRAVHAEPAAGTRAILTTMIDKWSSGHHDPDEESR